MKSEIQATVNFLCSYAQRFGSIKNETIEKFRSELERVLYEHYQGHWYPEKPIKGQAYRSLEFNKDNNYCDAIVARVCQSLGLTPDLLGLRHELTLWVDPYEVTMRLGNHVCAKDNQQLSLARFDKNNNEISHQDLDAILAQSRIPMVSSSRLSPTNLSSSESSSNSGSSTPQRTSSPQTVTTHSMYRNDPLFTPPRTLSPQAAAFQMAPSSYPMNIPFQFNASEHSMNIDEYFPMEENLSQPARSDTPQSVNSTTSNESNDSGYCGYVESYPYYYKLNRLYKALAMQKFSNQPGMRKNPHNRRVPHTMNHQQQQQMTIPPGFSTSPTTPTPMNIDQLAPFFDEKPSYQVQKLPIGSRKFKY